MSTSGAAARVQVLTAELEAKLLRRLLDEWLGCNWRHFGDALRPPLLALSDAEHLLGTWSGPTRTLSLSRRAIFELSWLDVLEVLKHEMAHQFVDEVLGGEALPHGPLFRQVCQARGIDAGATTRLRQKEPDAVEDRAIARVKKLLALAQSSNRHEAELAASTAQRIMLKLNVDWQAHTERRPHGYRYAQVGVPTGRVQGYQSELAGLLIEHFFVDGIWVRVYEPSSGRSGTVLELCGRPENVQMAEFVHDFVLRTIERLWIEHKRTHRVRSNRDRRSFLTGAVAGFSAKLREQRVVATSEGLVWKGDAGLGEYVRWRHRRLSSRGSARSANANAYAEGRAAGKTIVLSQPIATTEERAQRRALPSGQRS